MNYTKESFDKWLDEKPEKLKSITEDFAIKAKLNLDFSLESLDNLEAWILKNYDVASDLKEEYELLDLLALYVGETYIKHIGGDWFVELTDKDSIFYGYLVMKYKEGEEDEFRSAKLLCTSCISRKKGNLISRTLKKSMDKAIL